MIIGNSIDKIYVDIISKVLSTGYYVEDKSGYKELLGESFKLTNPRNRIIQNNARKINLPFQLAECIWIFSGNNELNMIASYAPKWKEFSDDGITLHGAYGKRLRNWYNLDQISNIENILKDSPLTRQAVLTIFDPSKDLTVKTKDVPCNSILQFLIRDNKLNLIVYVRSQDLILGLPYDLFHWTIFQEYLSNLLDIELGEYITHYGSVHIYKHDFEKAVKIIQEGCIVDHPMNKMPKTERDIFSKLYYLESVIRKEKKIVSIDDEWWNEWLIIFRLKWCLNEYKDMIKNIKQKSFLKVLKC